MSLLCQATELLQLLAGAKPAQRAVGPGLQIFDFIILPFAVLNNALFLWGQLKSLRAQSVSEVSAY